MNSLPMAELILEIVKKNPGMTTEEIFEALIQSTGIAFDEFSFRKNLGKLLEMGSIEKTGKRPTRFSMAVNTNHDLKMLYHLAS